MERAAQIDEANAAERRQLSEEEEQDAKCEAKKKKEIQTMEDALADWCHEALGRQAVETGTKQRVDMRRGMGVDRVNPQMPLDVADGLCAVIFPQTVETARERRSPLFLDP